MNPREAGWRARFLAHGVAAAGLAVVVSTVVAAAGEVLVLATSGTTLPAGWAWQLAGFWLPAAALLGVLYGQARWARSQADAPVYGWFMAGAGLVLAGFWGLLASIVAGGGRLDTASLLALGGLPLAGGALLWRARGAVAGSGFGPGY
jgi:hypothetical protein